MSDTKIFDRERFGDCWRYLDDDEAEFAFIVWPDYSIDLVDDFIEGRQGVSVSSNTVTELKEIRHDALQAFKAKDFALMMAHTKALHLACRVAGMHDAAVLGVKFKRGRKLKTGGPIRKAIAKLLSTAPSLKNPELWVAIEARPPRGWRVFNNRTGKYIEGPKAGDGMQYERFCTVAGEERKKSQG